MVVKGGPVPEPMPAMGEAGRRGPGMRCHISCHTGDLWVAQLRGEITWQGNLEMSHDLETLGADPRTGTFLQNACE